MRFCPLYSGSSGNALFVEGGNARVLIDAGLPGKTIENALLSVGVEPDTINAVLVSHEHSDHIRGVGVLARRFHVPVYASGGTWRGMEPFIGEVPDECVRVFECGRGFVIDELEVLPFASPHDANESCGFTFTHGGQKVSSMTDIGHVSERMMDAVSGSNLLLIEANHDVELLKTGSYPYPLKRRILSDTGHLSNDDCGRALVSLYSRGVHRAILGHLSHENNFESLAYESVRACLRAADIPDESFSLAVAHRDRVGEMCDID